MEASKINWILAIACLFAGIGLGALGYHLLNSSAASLQKLRKRLAERDRELAALREGVDEHLDEVSRLVAALQRDGEALASHLAQDARRLGGKGAPRAGLEPAAAPVTAPEADEALPTPRDYADGTGGTLSEDFGLKSDENTRAPQPPRY
ncbi:DUF1043 family protein [Halomonas sp. BM-2019]|uniref:YhcB family protein n=1 Tax=Halomonas sp. BM-2019 TaxID=2811227 RepID=UPI001B3C2361|nr:MAG: DUF1043 family protein [Halomonas sp. BM-2019]